MRLDALGWTKARQEEFVEHARQGRVPGRIIGEHRTHVRVATEVDERDAELTGRLRNDAGQRSDLPGVGDFVALRLGEGEGPATIEAVLSRTSALIRKASGENRPQLLAANVDCVLIVTAPDGDFNIERLQRYLKLVRESGALPVIVINKADLASGLEGALAEIAEIAPDVATHLICARDGTGLAALGTYLAANKTIVLVGSSGVGKSTLTNRLLGEKVQETQPVRAHDNRGRHTTTHRELFVRNDGGIIMDTPGLRGLEIWDPTEASEPNYDDIETLAAECKFRDCRHGREPACAVRAAAERGEIDADKLREYIGRENARREAARFGR